MHRRNHNFCELVGKCEFTDLTLAKAFTFTGLQKPVGVNVHCSEWLHLETLRQPRIHLADFVAQLGEATNAGWERVGIPMWTMNRYAGTLKSKALQQP